MTRHPRWTVLVVVLALGCGVGDSRDTAGGTVDLEALLPEAASMAGWRIVKGPTGHGPGTLFEYLNGGAERYVDHGFRRLVHVRYQAGDDPLACVTLDVFDMGSDLGAFGIYSAGRAPEWEAREWGVDGYQHGTVAAAWKGPVFVHGVADDQRPVLIAVLHRLVAGVADSVPGDPIRPAVLDLLPSELLVARSERYAARDLLGHAFLPGGLLATYSDGGRSSEVFVCELGDAAEASVALAALGEHAVRWGEVVDPAPEVGDEGFRFRDPVLGRGVAVRVGRYVAGIHGDLPRAVYDEVVARLVERLAEDRAQP